MTVPAPYRVAIYYAPDASDPLAQAAASWFAAPGHQEITRDARRYGFHATLKPPFRLRDGIGWNDLMAAAEALARGIPPFPLPRLAVSLPYGFLALCETAPSPKLQALADAAIAELDPLRAPLDSVEIARRRPERLSPAERRMLERWGYPHCFATWFFHMTIAQHLAEPEQQPWRQRAEAHFAAALAAPRIVESLAIFTEPAPGAPFSEATRIPLRG